MGRVGLTVREATSARPERSLTIATRSAIFCRWSHGTTSVAPPGTDTVSRTLPMSKRAWNSGSAAAPPSCPE